jgi:hypothetical protein
MGPPLPPLRPEMSEERNEKCCVRKNKIKNNSKTGKKGKRGKYARKVKPRVWLVLALSFLLSNFHSIIGLKLSIIVVKCHQQCVTNPTAKNALNNTE